MCEGAGEGRAGRKREKKERASDGTGGGGSKLGQWESSWRGVSKEEGGEWQVAWRGLQWMTEAVWMAGGWAGCLRTRGHRSCTVDDREDG